MISYISMNSFANMLTKYLLIVCSFILMFKMTGSPLINLIICFQHHEHQSTKLPFKDEALADTRRMPVVHTDGWNLSWPCWNLHSPQPFPSQKENTNQPWSRSGSRQAALVPLDGMGFKGASPMITSKRLHGGSQSKDLKRDLAEWITSSCHLLKWWCYNPRTNQSRHFS